MEKKVSLNKRNSAKTVFRENTSKIYSYEIVLHVIVYKSDLSVKNSIIHTEKYTMVTSLFYHTLNSSPIM
jgi:hypothetical protein